MPRIYVETSVISYLTARPSRDLIVAARQEATHEWWGSRSEKFAAFSSQLVLKEVAAGDPEAAMRRLAICQPPPLLPIDAKCETLAERLVSTGAVPPTEPEDALHIALATIAQVDFIATWNFAHLVGPVAKFRLQLAIQQLGYPPPILATPEELLETLP